MTLQPPVCPVHREPMRAPRKGDPAKNDWFCPKKVGAGWCDQKAKAIEIGGPASVALPVAESANHRDNLAIACLEFARSTGERLNLGKEETMAIARDAFITMSGGKLP